MKKIISIAILIALTSGVSAQSIFSGPKIQDPANAKTAFLFMDPTTSSITLRGYAGEELKVVAMITIIPGRNGKLEAIPVWVTMSPGQYDSVVAGFHSTAYANASKNKYIGYMYGISYIESYSWISKKKIRKLRNAKDAENSLSEKQVTDLRAFNESQKFIMTGIQPHPIEGYMSNDPASYGTIVPFIPSNSDGLKQDPTPDPVAEAFRNKTATTTYTANGNGGANTQVQIGAGPDKGQTLGGSQKKSTTRPGSLIQY